LKRIAIILGVIFGFVAFAAALYNLFALRFSSGDVYPAYSSLRADPLGTRALYESLELMPGRQSRRLLGPLPTEPQGAGTTLLLLGCDVVQFHEVTKREANALEQFASLGGRVVVTFAPERTVPLRASARITGTNAPPQLRRGLGNPPPTPEQKNPRFSEASLRERWSFDVEYAALKFDADGKPKPEVVSRQPGAPTELPDTLSWHTSVAFRNLGDPWRTIYSRSGKPVILERDWGRGSLVLVADSYAFSNQAMRLERQTSFVLWCLGNSRGVWFDETHLGVEESPGMATLARRYRLVGFALGLLVLAGLFVWQTATSFLPRSEAGSPADGELAGRESAAGFVNLLRRGVAPGELLDVCFQEWAKTAKRDGISDARIQQARDRMSAESIRRDSERNPVQAYRDLTVLLANRMRASAPTPAIAPNTITSNKPSEAGKRTVKQ